jgi:hypothetical protein
VENTKPSPAAKTTPALLFLKTRMSGFHVYRFYQQRGGKVAHAVTHIQQKKTIFENFIAPKKFPVTTRVSGRIPCKNSENKGEAKDGQI